MSEAPIEIARKIIKGEGRTPILLTEVKENSTTLMKKQNIVALTETDISFFNSSNGKTKAVFPWISLKKVEFSDGGVKFTFGNKKVAIEANEFNNFVGILGHILRQVLPSFLLQSCGLKTYGFYKVKNSNFGAFIRFISTVKEHKISLPNATYSAFEAFLRFTPSNFNLSSIPEIRRFSKLFFSILPLVEKLNHITIPIYETISSFADSPETLSKIRSISFVGQKQPQFLSFLEKFKQMQKKKLRAISFTNLELAEQDVAPIASFIQSNNITSLGFHSAFDYEAQKFFYTKILVSNIAQKLTILNLDNTKNVDLQKLIPLIQNVTLLSLAFCNLQVADALRTIATSKFPNLKFLNLSGNISATSPTDNCMIPKQLYSLMLNNIEWHNTSLVDMLKVIFSKGLEPFKLSISYAATRHDVWPYVFDLFAQTNYRSLTAFTWDGNPIHKNLFVFLHANSFLDYLSLSECFHHEIKESVADLANFIDSTSRLKFLILRGSNKNHVGQMCGPLFRSVAMSPSIVHFDITGNQIGDAGISQFRTLITNNKILQVVALDGSQPDDPMLFLEAYNIAAQNKNRVHVSFPIEDVMYLMKNEKITEEQKQKFLQSFQTQPVLKKGKKECMFKAPTSSPFLQPFNVFLYKPQDQFPNFMTDEQLELLRNPPALPPLPPKPVMQRRAASVKKPMRPVQRPNQPLSPVSQRFAQVASNSRPRNPKLVNNSPPPPEPYQVPFFLQGIVNNIDNFGFDSDSSYYTRDYSDGPEIIIMKAAPEGNSGKRKHHRSNRNDDNGPEISFGTRPQAQNNQQDQGSSRRKHSKQSMNNEPQIIQEQPQSRRKHHREPETVPVAAPQSGRRRHGQDTFNDPPKASISSSRRGQNPNQMNIDDSQQHHRRKHSLPRDDQDQFINNQQQQPQRRSQSVSGSRRTHSSSQAQQNPPIEEQSSRRRKHSVQQQAPQPQKTVDWRSQSNDQTQDDIPKRRKHSHSTVGDQNEIIQRNQQNSIPQYNQEERSHRRKKLEPVTQQQTFGAPEDQVSRRKKVRASSVTGNAREISDRNKFEQIEAPAPERRKKVRATSNVGNGSEIIDRNSQMGIQQDVSSRRKAPSNDNAPYQQQTNDDGVVLRRKKRSHSVAADKTEMMDRNRELDNNQQANQPQEQNDIPLRRKKRVVDPNQNQQQMQPQQNDQNQENQVPRRRRVTSTNQPSAPTPVVAPLVQVKPQQEQPTQQQQSQAAPVVRRRRNPAPAPSNSVFNIGAPVQQHNQSSTVPAAAFRDSNSD